VNPASLRNKAIRTARGFFAAEYILEVITPKAVASPALEPYIDALAVHSSQNTKKLWLATSPEFALKKIFSTEISENPGARGIYEIAPVFRDDRPGKHHGIEFTMVEWYVNGSSLIEILEMAARLIARIAHETNGESLSLQLEIINLRDFFLRGNCAFDFTDEQSVVRKYQSLHGSLPYHLNGMDAAIACFNLLFDEYVLPAIRNSHRLIAVSGYPEYLGALAFTQNGVAERAEIFYRGLELANGYREEFRSDVARQRWSKYNAIRNLRGCEAHALDEDLMRSLPAMANVAGIAVGLERVLMALYPDLDIPSFR
jgi:lysyl-tRNA synthetase class 2